PHLPQLLLFTDPATTAIYTLSLHDALPISTPRSASARRTATRPSPPGTTSCSPCSGSPCGARWTNCAANCPRWPPTTPDSCGPRDRKSTRLNSSHVKISYAVFCLKKKKKTH